MITAEQQARDILERMEIEGAQNYSSGEIVEIANLITDASALRAERDRLRKVLRLVMPFVPCLPAPGASGEYGDALQIALDAARAERALWEL